MSTESDRLQARLAELEAKLLDAEALAAAKDDFIAGISRELSNPLAPVLLAMERLRAVQGARDAARSEAALLLLERAVAAFDQRTRVLLSLADITAGLPAPPPTEVDVSALAAAAATRHEEVARRAGCAFSPEIEPGLRAAAQPDSLAQVLDYLLTNAFRFGAGRPVRLRACAASGGKTMLSVIDQGPGLTAQEAAEVFRLFNRPRRPLEPGLGVVLWVAAKLVTAMGGRIWVESTPGQGAQFHVSLAAASSCPPIEAPAETAQSRDVSI